MSHVPCTSALSTGQSYGFFIKREIIKYGKLLDMNYVQLVVKAVTFSGVPAELLFKFAYHYYEVRVSKQFIVQRFLDYLHKDKVPDVVQDYCLELLSHHTEAHK